MKKCQANRGVKTISMYLFQKLKPIFPLFLLCILQGAVLSCSHNDAEQASLNVASTSREQAVKQTPNVVIFYVDDLGYGDLSSYGAKGVSTPNVDALAQQGIRFTDAHSSAATCTPSRYSLLTGQYAFRNNARVLQGDAPLLIDPEQTTLADIFKRANYATAVIGKWHLGLGDGQVNWNEDVKPGPLELGFDYSFLIPATGDRVPTVYLENYRVQGLEKNDPLQVSYAQKVGLRPTGIERPDLLRQAADPQHSESIVNGISRIGWMAGGKSAEWVDEDFAELFTGKAKEFIDTNRHQPFMLFFPFHDIHVPRLPHERFKGKSSMGPRGDAIVQMDWMTGQIVEHLKKLSLYENTVIIFTSDNGPVLNDGYADGAIELLGEHDPSGGFRGGKYSAFESGTRVPMIVSYPNGINKSGDSSALISQVDFYRSFAAMLGVDLAVGDAVDSEDHHQALLSASVGAREYLLEESIVFSLRKGPWKYIEPTTQVHDWIDQGKGIDSGVSTAPQLFNLSSDPGERNNIASSNPEIVSELKAKLAEITAGR